MWTESEVERWFIANPELPGGERLLLVSRQQALQRVVDLLFLDHAGGLVLLEVKNETSTRAVIGQALEYLSQYEGIELDALLDDLNADEGAAETLASAIRDAGITEITRHRRIFLTAPRFDFATQSAVSLLNERFAKADLQLGLIAVTPVGKEFATAFVTAEKPRAIRDLRGRCGVSPRGRLFFILPDLPNNMAVSLGRLRDGQLIRPKGPTATQRLVRQKTDSLVPYDGPYFPELGAFGAVYRHRTRPRHAVILARVRDIESESDGFVYFALEEAGALIGYRIRTATNFNKWYSPATGVGITWKQLLPRAV